MIMEIGALKSMVKAVPIAIVSPMVGLMEGFADVSKGIRHEIDRDVFYENRGKYKKNALDDDNE